MDKLGEKRNLSLLFSQEAHTTNDYPFFFSFLLFSRT